LTIKSAQHTKNTSQFPVHSQRPTKRAFAADYRLSTIDCPSRRFAFLFTVRIQSRTDQALGKRHTIQFSKIVEYPASTLVSLDLVPACPPTRRVASGCWGWSFPHSQKTPTSATVTIRISPQSALRIFAVTSSITFKSGG